MHIPCTTARRKAAFPGKARRGAGSGWWLAAVAGLTAWWMAAAALGEVPAETWRKLGEIRVPRVEFVDVAPVDVLEFVRVMVTEGTGNPEMGFEIDRDVEVAALPPVTLALERASARDILRSVDEALGVRTELNADGRGWVVRRVVRTE